MLDTLFFWQDGAVTTPLAEAVLRQLQALGGAALDHRTRLAVRDWLLELHLGHLDGESFCRKMEVLVPAVESRVDLADRFLEAVELQPGMAAVLAEVKARYGIRLVTSYPRDWLAAEEKRLGLGAFFDSSEVLVCREAGLGKTVPDVFPWALRAAGRSLEQSLWVADQPAMTTAAVRMGLDAILFFESRRFRRELCLRGMLPTR